MLPRSVETPGRTLPCRLPKDMSADVRNPVLMVGSRALSHEAEIPGTIDVLQSILDVEQRWWSASGEHPRNASASADHFLGGKHHRITFFCWTRCSFLC